MRWVTDTNNQKIIDVSRPGSSITHRYNMMILPNGDLYIFTLDDPEDGATNRNAVCLIPEARRVLADFLNGD